MAKKQRNVWQRIKTTLQNSSANFPTETLCFSDKKIFVKSNMAEYFFWGTFAFAGIISLCVIPGQEASIPWLGYLLAILFTAFGILMLYISASKKRPYFDLENQLFYPLQTDRKTPIKISEISSLAIFDERRWYELRVIRKNKFYTLYHSRGAMPLIHGQMLAEKFNLPCELQSYRSSNKFIFIKHYGLWLIGLTAAVYFFAGGSYNNCIVPIIEMKKSKNWIETPATILYSEFKKCTYETTARPPVNNGGGLGFVIKPSKKRHVISDFVIEYEYEWKNKKYQSDRYDFFLQMPTNIGEKQMREIAENHPARKQVSCFVNPDNPEESVLSREIFWSHYLWGYIIVPILIAALTAFVSVVKDVCVILKYILYKRYG